MRNPELKRITAALRQLTPVQRKVVSAELASLDAQPASTVIIEGRFAAAASCPHCESKRVIRHGHANGLQRYRCREFGKTFSALTGTPLCGLHKRGKWLDQAGALRVGLTLHQVADALCIHVSTAHRWRHRFLAQPKTVQPRALTGIAEADETMFLLSFKGKRSGLGRSARKRVGRAAKRGLSHEQVPVLVARDRAGATMDCVLEGNGHDDAVCRAEAVPDEGRRALHRRQLRTGRRSAPAGCGTPCRQPFGRHPRRRRLARAERQCIPQQTQILDS